MNMYELLELLETTSGTNDKIQLLKKNDSPELREFLDIALNKDKKFGLKKLDGSASGEPLYNTLKEITNYLQNQNGSHEARDHTLRYLNAQSEIKRKWDTKAILKKSIASTGTSLVNKAFPNLVYKFKLMKADQEVIKLEDIIFPAIQQRKYDGFRCLRQLNGIMRSSSGKLQENRNLPEHIKGDIGYLPDGELYSHKVPFNEISSILRKEDREIPDHIKLIVYDAITQEEFDNRKCMVPYKERIKRVEELAKGLTNAVVAESFMVNSIEEVVKLDNQFLAEGYEGSMIKNPNGLYMFKRTRLSQNIIAKYKPFIEVDGKVIDVFEGEDNFEGKLGGIIVQVEGVTNPVRVGSGFKLKNPPERDYYWENSHKIIGQWVRIKAKEITDKGQSLREPVFRGIRESKD